MTISSSKGSSTKFSSASGMTASVNVTEVVLLDVQLMLELALSTEGEVCTDDPAEDMNGGIILIGGLSVTFGEGRVGVSGGDDEDDIEEKDGRRNICFAALAAYASFATPNAC